MTGSDDLTATDPNKVNAIKLSLMLADLRLPTINQLWKSFAKRADAEGWTAARFLAALAEHELAERDRRRIERHLREARLLPGKSLASFDFKAVPMLAKAQVMALAAGDGWLNQGANCLVFGPPGAGKSHLASAIGLALVENGYRVLFTRTTDLVQRLQVARRELALESQLARLDRYHLLILDDLAYVQKDQAETSVLFELISARYERRSLPDNREPALRRMEQGVPGRDHCGGRRRSPRPPRHNPRDERRELSPPRRARQTKKGTGAARQDRHREKHHRGLSHARVPPRRRSRSLPAARRHLSRRAALYSTHPAAIPHSDIAPIGRRRSATICVCRASTINETKALAMPDAARNHAPAAGAGNLTLIDARLSSRSSRYSKRLGWFRYQVVRIWRKWLARRSRLRRLNWDRMANLLKKYPLPPATITRSWQKLLSEPVR